MLTKHRIPLFEAQTAPTVLGAHVSVASTSRASVALARPASRALAPLLDRDRSTRT
ncbi:MAG: hypothetical protein ABW186_15900 [Rhodanobacteraceae bacterium]